MIVTTQWGKLFCGSVGPIVLSDDILNIWGVESRGLLKIIDTSFFSVCHIMLFLSQNWARMEILGSNGSPK